MLVRASCTTWNNTSSVSGASRSTDGEEFHRDAAAVQEALDIMAKRQP